MRNQTKKLPPKGGSFFHQKVSRGKFNYFPRSFTSVAMLSVSTERSMRIKNKKGTAKISPAVSHHQTLLFDINININDHFYVNFTKRLTTLV